MRNFAICNNVDVPRGYYNKGKSQTEEDIKKKTKNITIILKKIKNTNRYKLRYREQTGGCKRD